MSSTFITAPPMCSQGTYRSSAWEEKGVGYAGKGQLVQVLCANKNAAAVYLYLFDNASAASGNTLCPPIPIAVNGIVNISEHIGIPFTNGIYFAASSTLGTYSALGSNDINLLLQFAPKSGS